MKAVQIIFVFLLESFLVFGQSEYISKQEVPYIFYNYQRKKFTVIDDSTGCHEYNEKTKSWDFRPLTFQLEEPFARFLTVYNLLHEKGSEIFFVDKGCGMVYVLKNDTVKRDDRSTHHANQFDGTFFLYNGEPHIFGGYGLFQYKNIITRYDINDKEWYAYDFSGPAPEPRNYCPGWVENNKFYIAGGFGGDTKLRKQYNDVWMFDLKLLKWKRLGIFNKFKREAVLLPRLFPIVQGCKEILRDDFFYKPRFSKNTLEVYELFQKGKVHSLIKGDSKYLVHKVNVNNFSAEISIVDSSFLFRKPLYSGRLLKPQTSNQGFSLLVLWIVIIILSLATTFYVFFVRSKKINKDINDILSINEKALLNIFLTNGPIGIEISLINDLVNHDQPNIDTLKKRRDNLLREFKQKLATHFLVDPDAVLIEEKHITDKRVKILKLQQNIADKLLESSKGK
jgi:uncharacterized protein YneF (UPF0154 family)